MPSKNFLLRKASTVLYPKCYNRNSYDESITYTKKKEGLISYLTVDNYHALYKIADIQHSARRKWIVRKKKRSFNSLKKLQNPTSTQHAHSLVLTNTQTKLQFQIKQRMQIKTFLPFLTTASYEYISNLNRSLSLFKNLKPNFSALKPRRNKKKLRTLNRTKILTSLYPQNSTLNAGGVKNFTSSQNFYVLKPIVGGFKAYTANALGFLPRVQMKKICRFWVRRLRNQLKKVQGKTKRTHLIKNSPAQIFSPRIISVLPRPLNIKDFTRFKVSVNFSALYKKKKFANAKTKKMRSRIKGRIKFIFKFYKQKPFWRTKSFLISTGKWKPDPLKNQK